MWCHGALVQHHQKTVELKKKLYSNKLGDLVMKEYKSTSIPLLKIAHKTITSLLPAEDGECFAAAKLAVEYAREWRPQHVLGILMCESHKHIPPTHTADTPLMYLSCS